MAECVIDATEQASVSDRQHHDSHVRASRRAPLSRVVEQQCHSSQLWTYRCPVDRHTYLDGQGAVHKTATVPARPAGRRATASVIRSRRWIHRRAARAPRSPGVTRPAAPRFTGVNTVSQQGVSQYPSASARASATVRAENASPQALFTRERDRRLPISREVEQHWCSATDSSHRIDGIRLSMRAVPPVI